MRLLISRCCVARMLACVVVCVAAGSARAEESNTRDLIRAYFKNPAITKDKVAKTFGLADVGSVVALEYTVLLIDGDTESAVDPAKHQFQLGDKIRVQIEPLRDMHIYIFQQGASGKQTCLLPKDDEQPAAAKAGKTIVLPDTGAIQFAPPAGEEKLIVVATEKPIDNLAALANVVFKKPDAELSAEEKQVKQKLQASGEKMLKSIRQHQAEGSTFRGLLTDDALAKLAKQSAGKTRAMVEEPPHGKTKSSLALAIESEGGDSTNLLVAIPLKSVKK